MTRSTLLGTLLCVAFVAVETRADEARPNVLFIAVDDLNDWIGCLGGHEQTVTPNIDRLAEMGTLFTRSYCAAPACNPSRAALLTGMRPWTSGVYHNNQPWRPAMPDAVTLQQHFMSAGYHVVGSGKIFHGGYEDEASWHEYQRKVGDPRPADDVLEDPHSRANGIVWGVLDVEDSEMGDYASANHAIEYLSQSHDRPFFLACGLYRPHMPWQVPRQYYDMFPVADVILPTVLSDDLADIPAAGVRMARPEGDHANVVGSDNWPYAVQAYLASIAFADGQVGRVIDALEASDYADNTIVVLWGDHGWHLGEKAHWRKFALWEEATRAPLIFVAPGITSPGSRCERAVDFMNIYPTLCELCGLGLSEQLDGVSMLPLLNDPSAEWDRPAVTTHGRGNHAVRSERFRLIHYADGSEELYDHDSDPLEWTNLAGDPAYSDVIANLRTWLPAVEADDAATQQELRQSME